jgi:outer membrane protein OmpA-like peptidoglycan-associated protein
MRRIILFCVLTAVGLGSYGQLTKTDVATTLTSRLRFAEAYPIWSEIAEESLEKGKPDWHAVRMACESATKSEQFQEAHNWNLALLESGLATPNEWADAFALALRTSNYATLPQLMSGAKSAYPTDAKLLDWINRAAQVDQLIQDSARFEIARVRPGSPHDEFGAVPFEKGLIFVSNGLNAGFLSPKDGWTEEEYFDLAFIADTSNPEPRLRFWDEIRGKDLWPGFERTNAHDGPLAFSHDGKWAVLTRNKTETDTLNRIVLSRLELVLFQRINNVWSPTTAFPYNDVHWSVAHGTFAPDGSLILASDRPGGFGGMDLYRCAWDGKYFAPPVNLGQVVNSSGNDVFPFADSEGNVYFSSDGHPGAGGLDVFCWNGNVISRIPRPISTAADDFAYFIQNKTGKGYFSSNRETGKDAIYRFTRMKDPAPVRVRLKGCDGSILAGNRVDALNAENQLWGSDTTDTEGWSSFVLPPGERFSFVFSGNTEFLASEAVSVRPDSVQELVLTARKPSANWTLKTIGSSNEPLAGVLLTLTREDGTAFRTVTDQRGEFQWQPGGNLTFTSVLADQINRTRGVLQLPAPDLTCPNGASFTIPLPELAQEEAINLGSILYDLNKFTLRPEGMRELNKLVKYMTQHPELRVELSSHTDSRAGASYNQTLSQNRAQSCVDYIVAQGINPSRILAKGFGESEPLNRCRDGVSCSEEEHQANRRTELKLIDE